ncbi:hypothetical protein RJD24_08415 [Bacillaceae bacterium IKA-2]|nr:hypothetical protein RJD24_08415 [Bacillaceae bacterium IKA-2]
MKNKKNFGLIILFLFSMMSYLLFTRNEMLSPTDALLGALKSFIIIWIFNFIIVLIQNKMIERTWIKMVEAAFKHTILLFVILAIINIFIVSFF